MDLAFLTPLGGLIAVVALVPLVALLRRRSFARRVRSAIGLAQPGRRFYLVPVAALVATAALLGTAATQPVVSVDVSR